MKSPDTLRKWDCKVVTNPKGWRRKILQSGSKVTFSHVSLEAGVGDAIDKCLEKEDRETGYIHIYTKA